MKHRVLGGLTAAFVMSSFGAPLTSHAQEVDDQNLKPQAEAANGLDNVTASAATADPSNPSAGPDSAAPLDSVTADSELLSARSIQPAQTSGLVSVFSHPLDSNQAATLYIRSIPVITFVGDGLSSLQTSKSLGDGSTSAIDPGPASRADAVATRLEEFQASNQDASSINVRWDADQEAYVVSLAGEDLVMVDDKTILPDTTREPAEDALQMTNRLRRLLGNAPPLDAIEGQPQPDPQDTVLVTSTTTGMASWYGPGFHGRRSANGEVFNQNALTAAHRTLPFGTQVRVTNLSNGRQVVVRITDRGPYGHGRIIDLSTGAASTIGLTQSGVAPVKLEVLSNAQQASR